MVVVVDADILLFLLNHAFCHYFIIMIITNIIFHIDTDTTVTVLIPLSIIIT